MRGGVCAPRSGAFRASRAALRLWAGVPGSWKPEACRAGGAHEDPQSRPRPLTALPKPGGAFPAPPRPPQPRLRAAPAGCAAAPPLSVRSRSRHEASCPPVPSAARGRPAPPCRAVPSAPHRTEPHSPRAHEALLPVSEIRAAAAGTPFLAPGRGHGKFGSTFWSLQLFTNPSSVLSILNPTHS